MLPRTRRLWYLSLLFTAAIGITTIVLVTLQDYMIFFVTPSDVKEGKVKPLQFVRLGGMVAKESVKKEGINVSFMATDFAHTLPVAFKGITPDLFKEEQGFVAEGRLRPDGVFEATTILAKHDENYMPREVKEKLRPKKES